MADIILKGRDARGDLVDNVYKNIETLSVKTAEGKNIEFYSIPFDGTYSYLAESVEENGKGYLKPIAPGGLISGAKGMYSEISEEKFNEYKSPTTNAGNLYYRLIYIITRRELETGGLYTLEEILTGGD